MQQRPTGISVLAIAILISAVIRFIISFIDMALGSWLSAMANSPGYIVPQAKAAVDAIGDLGFWIGLFGMITAVVMLIAVRGLWTMAKWGWWLALATLLIALVLNLIPMVQGTVNWRLIVQSLFDLVFLVYLLTPHVRAAFSPAPPDVSAPA
jgi:hypothetical protein